MGGNGTGEARARDLLTSLSLLPLAWGSRLGFEDKGGSGETWLGCEGKGGHGGIYFEKAFR